jgi:hypothetical protein
MRLLQALTSFTLVSAVYMGLNLRRNLLRPVPPLPMSR